MTDGDQTTAPPLVSLKDLWVERGGVPILRGVTADIARGRITALIGLNGSGKSTLLRVLVGELPYRSGAIRFKCGSWYGSSVRHGIGPVFPISASTTCGTRSQHDSCSEGSISIKFNGCSVTRPGR